MIIRIVLFSITTTEPIQTPTSSYTAHLDNSCRLQNTCDQRASSSLLDPVHSQLSRILSISSSEDLRSLPSEWSFETFHPVKKPVTIGNKGSERNRNHIETNASNAVHNCNLGRENAKRWSTREERIERKRWSNRAKYGLMIRSFACVLTKRENGWREN